MKAHGSFWGFILVVVFYINLSHAQSNDPLHHEQWYLSKIGLNKLDPSLVNSLEVVVAIIDTGVDLSHEDLKEQLFINHNEIANNNKDDDHNGYVDDIMGWDFQDHDNYPMDEDDYKTGHGTIAAGVLAAASNNYKGIAGIGNHIKIMPLRAFNPSGTSTDEILAAAIDYAVKNGAQVINASFGGYQKDQAPKLISAIERARAQNVIIVASAGNYGNSNDQNEFLPASLRLDNIISVAASNQDDTKWPGSNYGRNTVDIAAPGVDIITTKMGNTYGRVTGTSIATPVAAGVVALMKALKPELDAKSIKNIVLSTGKKVPIETACNCRIDAFAAVEAVLKN